MKGSAITGPVAKECVSAASHSDSFCAVNPMFSRRISGRVLHRTPVPSFKPPLLSSHACTLYGYDAPTPLHLTNMYFSGPAEVVACVQCVFLRPAYCAERATFSQLPSILSILAIKWYARTRRVGGISSKAIWSE